MATINVADSILPKIANKPTREGERVTDISDISNIKLPFVGQIVYVENEGKHYKITQLTEDKRFPLTWKLLSDGDVAGVFKWKGEKNSVEDLDNETATAQAGDTWSVKDVGNYSFVPESRVFRTYGGSKYTFIDNVTLPQVVSSGQLATVKMTSSNVYAQLSGNDDGGYVLLEVSASNDNVTPTGRVLCYDGTALSFSEDGENVIKLYKTNAHWMSMGGNAVTKAEVENSINTAKTELSTSFNSSLNDKQNALSSKQMDAINSGITATILTELKDGCLASADETNGLIKVKISGTDSYMYVQAAKLEAPETPDFKGNTTIFATSEVVKIGAECETEGAVIRYSVGENEVTESSPVMTEAGVGIIQDALKDKYENGVQLKVNIRAFKYGIGSSTFSRTFTIYRKIENPTITIKSGTTDYDSPRYIKITVPVGTTVRYTTNGNTPTTTSGTIYSGEFLLTKTSEETYTVKAIAYREGWSRSGEASKSVTINKKPEVRFGFSTKTGVTGNTWSDNAEIESILTNVKKGITSMTGGNNYVATPATDSYVWFAVLKSSNITISKDPANTSGFGSLALQKSGSSIKKYDIGDYYLYRADSLMASGKQMSVKF